MSVDGAKLFCTLLVESDAIRHMTGRKQPIMIRFDCRDRISCTFHVSGPAYEPWLWTPTQVTSERVLKFLPYICLA